MSIEFEPAWTGTIVFDGYVMRALEIEKVLLAGKTRRT